MVESLKAVDEFVAEAEGRPIAFEWRGFACELPPELPAIVVVKAARLQRDMGAEAEVSPEAAILLLEDIFGAALLDRILTETRAPATAIPDLVEAAMTAYGEGIDSGNRAARRQAGRRASSKSGPRSKPTSGASTG